ncbi:MAG TPA: amidohydrolase family protein, partial [Fimbriimonadaceae bacterium]|nr:amidohydrolase family protein [Fimbriimonadaceae bacterium]
MKRTLTVLALVLAACAAVPQDFPVELTADRTPKVHTGGNCLIKHAHILTITNGDIVDGDILVRDGKIAAIGKNLSAPEGFEVIDATGKTVMPGIIDTHSHRGIDGTNEGSDSIVDEVRMRDVLNPTAKNVWQAVASGHTAGLVLHGSADAIGGESIIVKYKYDRPAKEMPIPDAPRVVKFALGENVTQKNGPGNTSRFPATRMGVEATYRRAFEAAKEYRAKQKRGEVVQKDLRLETLADILDGKVWVHCHSYRADEMLMLIRLSQEYGFKIGAMQHALEAYKIAPEMAAAGVGAGMFSDEWGYKVEAYDAIPFNAAICWKAGVLVSINTDGLSGTSALNIDAAKVMRFGGVPANEALKMITINPAKQLGIDRRTGSLEVGKDADISIWDGHPLSVYSKPVMTLIEGEVYFQRRDAWNVDGTSKIKSQLDDFKYLPEPPLPKPARTYAIVGATVHTVTNGTIDGCTVVVTDGKIVAVGKNATVPASATVIDGRGQQVFPGFIDGGASIGISEIGGIIQGNDSRELGTYQPDLKAATALYVESAYLGTSRYNGVTHSLSKPSGGMISGQASLIRHAGYTSEQLAMIPEDGLVVNFPQVATFPEVSLLDEMCCRADTWADVGLGYLDYILPPPAQYSQDHEDDLGGPAQRRFGRQVDPEELSARIKQLNEYFEKAKAYADNPPETKDLRLDAMIPYVRGEKPVFLNARSAATIRAAVDFARRFKLKAVLTGCAEAWKEADLLAKENIPVIIPVAGRSTLSANNTTNDWDPYDTPYVVPSLLAKAGVKFAFESDNNASVMMLPFRVGESCAY